MSALQRLQPAQHVRPVATSKVGFGWCTHRTSHRKSATWEPDGTSAWADHRCWCCKKIGFADTATGGGGALRRPQDDGGERPPMESYILGPHRAGRQDRHGNAAESPERHCGDGWSSAVKVHQVVVRRRVIGLQLQLRLVGCRRCVGGPADGSLRNNHGTCLSNENSDNADNPSEVVMCSVTGSPHCRPVSNKACQ